MPCPSLWRQKCSPRVSTVPGGGFDLATDPSCAHIVAGYTDEDPRGSTAESDSRWQFPIPVAFSILGALSPSQREKGACWLITTPPLADDMANTFTVEPSCRCRA